MNYKFKEDGRAIIDRYLDGVRKKHAQARQFHHGFIHCIDKTHFPLLSDKEIDDFKLEYSNIVNLLFPKE